MKVKYSITNVYYFSLFSKTVLYLYVLHDKLDLIIIINEMFESIRTNVGLLLSEVHIISKEI